MKERLQTIVDSVNSCQRVIDVGCDHGLVALALASRDDIQEVLATDISAPSLGKLEIALQDVDQSIRCKISTKVTDGLTKLPWDETNAIVIAGMGGDLILKILEEGKDIVNSSDQLVLSPHTFVDGVRKYCKDKGFFIQDEHLLFEENHFYEILVVDTKQNTKQEENVESYANINGLTDSIFTHAVFDKYDRERLQHFENYYGAKIIKKNSKELKDRVQKELLSIERILLQWENQNLRGDQTLSESVRNRKKELEGDYAIQKELLAYLNKRSIDENTAMDR